MNKRKATALASLIGLGLITVAGFATWRVRLAAYSPQAVIHHERGVPVTSIAFTHGTNHTFSRGIGLLGKYNTSLIARGTLPRTRSRQWSFATDRDTSVLWIAFTHSNALAGAGPPSVFAVLTSQSEFEGDWHIRTDDLRSILIDPSTNGGWLVQASDPTSSGFMTAWTLPERVTNYAGWWLHVVTKPEGQRIVSFRL